MAIFAPVYRASLTTRHQPRKHRRSDSLNDDDDDDDHGEETTARRQDDLATIHPVNQRDPYHVAGYSRDASSFPPPPFPHAAVKSREWTTTIQEELASLQPAIHLTETQLSAHHARTSLKRNHIDNLTTILHTCMLRGDWPRANRAWALLLRTEIEGKGIDVRRHERWKIGAELLLRRPLATDDPRPPQRQREVSASSDNDDDDDDDDRTTALPFSATPTISDQAFDLARQYYERLILQYPHTARSQSSSTSLIFYPALFNLWIYQVQARACRSMTTDSPPSSPPDTETSHQTLHEASIIAARMDELLTTPPCDTSAPLLQLRGMVGLWLADLCAAADDVDDEDVQGARYGRRDEHREKAAGEKQTAARSFARAKAAGARLPQSAEDVLIQEEESRTIG